MDKKTIILFGTGVLTNSWKPIINAINSVEIENIISTLDEANSYLTRVVYLLRYYTANNESLEITELNNLIFRIKKEIIFHHYFTNRILFFLQCPCIPRLTRDDLSLPTSHFSPLGKVFFPHNL